MARQDPDDYFVCNNCHGEVPGDAHVCPHCGADEETAWGENRNDHLLSDDFDYDAVTENEGLTKPRTTTKLWVVFLAIALLGVLLWRFLM